MDMEKYSTQVRFDLIERRFENIVLLACSTENSITSSFYMKEVWKCNSRREPNINRIMRFWRRNNPSQNRNR